MGGHYKIGRTTLERLASRMGSLSVAMVVPPKLLRLFVDPDGTLERRLHIRYARSRVRGEWFAPDEMSIQEFGLLDISDAGSILHPAQPLVGIKAAARMAEEALREDATAAIRVVLKGSTFVSEQPLYDMKEKGFSEEGS